MKPEDWIAACTTRSQEQDWDGLRNLRTDTCQQLLNTSTAPDIRNFFNEVASQALSAASFSALTHDTQEFQNQTDKSFIEIGQKLSTSDGIASVYGEFFYDGGDECCLNFFLCNSFDPDHDDWGSDFEYDNIIVGPSVLPWFSFDPEDDWDNRSGTVGKEYVNGMILAACVEAGSSQNYFGLPFGFAQHDHDLVSFATNHA